MAICAGCKHETFRSTVVMGEMYCQRCSPYAETRNVPGAMFPYTTTALDPSGTVVQSLPHLRRLEKEHGVASVVFNRDRGNWGPQPTDFKKICGHERGTARRSV